MARVGTAYLQIVASLKGVRQQIRDELSNDFAIKFDAKTTGIRTAINTELKAGFTVRLNAQLRGLRLSIQTELYKSDFRIRIDPVLVGLRLAIQAELDKKNFEVDVIPKLDTAFLRAQLAAIRGGTVTVDVKARKDDSIARVNRDLNETDRSSRRAGGAISRMFGEGGLGGFAANIRNIQTVTALFTSLGQILGVVASVGLLAVSSITALLPILGALAVAAGVAASAIMLLPAALGAAAAGIGVLAIGFNGVFEAIGAGWTAANVASKRGARNERAEAERIADAQTAVGKAVENRNRQVAAAELGLVKAVRDRAKAVSAAEQDVVQAVARRAQAVETAERSLIRAQESARDAQEALTRARADAREKLEDLRLELSGAALSEERATLNLERAQERLQAVTREGGSPLDRREAELAVREAAQGLAEVKERYIDVQQESAKANQEGVDGSREVVAATRDVAEANRRVGDEQRDLRQAQIEGDAAIAAARVKIREAEITGDEAVAAARLQLQQAQADGALAVAEAQRNLTQAQLRDADVTQTQLRNFEEAMARLSPAARALVTEVLALKPAFDRLALDVQDRLLAGLSTHFGTLATIYLPQLNTYLGFIAESFNHAILRMAAFFEQTDTQKRFGEAMGNIARTLDIIARTVDPILQAFFTLFVTGSRYLPKIAEAIEGVANRFNDFIQQADKSGALDNFFRLATDNLIKIMGIVEDLVVVFAEIFNSATVSGGGILDGIKLVTQGMRDFFTSTEGREGMASFFNALGETMKALAPGILALFKGIGNFLGRIGPDLPKVGQSLSTIFEKIAPILTDVAVAVFDAFAKALEWMSKLDPVTLTALTGVLTALVISPIVAPGLIAAWKLIGAIAGLVGIGGSESALAGIARGIAAVWGAVAPFAGGATAIGLLWLALSLPTILDQTDWHEKVDEWLNRVLEPIGITPSPRPGGGARPRPGSPGAEDNPPPVVSQEPLRSIDEVLPPRAPLPKEEPPTPGGPILTPGEITGKISSLERIVFGKSFDEVVKDDVERWGKRLRDLPGDIKREWDKSVSIFKPIDKMPWEVLRDLTGVDLSKINVDIITKPISDALGNLGKWWHENVEMKITKTPTEALKALIGIDPTTLSLDPIKTWFNDNWLPWWDNLWYGDPDGIVTKGHAAWDGLWNFFEPKVNEVLDKLKNWYTSTWQPWWDGLWYGDPDGIFTKGHAAWDSLWNFFEPKVNEVLDKLKSWYTDTWQPWWDALWYGEPDGIVTKGKAAWDSMWKFFEDKPKEIWGNFVGWWEATIVPRWNEMFAGIERRVQEAAGVIGAAWANIQNFMAEPINWVIDHVWNEAFGGLWKSANDMLLGSLGDFKPAARVGAAPTMPHNPRGASTFGLAEGGVIPGYRPGRDSVLAMLSPGEAVMRPEWARAIGPQHINAMNRVARQGGPGMVWNYLYGGDIGGPGLLAKKRKKAPTFAAGGTVDQHAITQGLAYAKSMEGVPYMYGGFSRAGIDCSGFMSAIANVLTGKTPYSGRFATSSFTQNKGAGGFLPGLGSAFTIGVRDGSKDVAHMAGTLGGINVESGSNHGPMVGKTALGSNNPRFPWHFFLPQVGGVFVGGPGGGSLDIGALVRGWFDQFLKPVKDSLGGAFGGKTTGLYGLPGGFIETLIKGATSFLMSKASSMFGDAAMGETSAETPGIVKIISDVARARFGGQALQAAVIGVATGIVETNLRNLTSAVDHDSLGVFQQRPSMGWGTPAQLTNVTYAAGKFFSKFPGNWMSMDPGALAQSIQRSAFGWKYGPQMGKARSLVAQYGGFDSGGILPPGLTLAYNGTHRPERVLTDEQWRALSAGAQGGDFRITSGEIEIVGDGIARIIDARLQRVGTAIDTGRRV